MSREAMYLALGGDRLTRRATTALYREFGALSACTTLDEQAEYLASLTADYLLDIRDFGPASFGRVTDFLAKEGRKLREYPIFPPA